MRQEKIQGCQKNSFFLRKIFGAAAFLIFTLASADEVSWKLIPDHLNCTVWLVRADGSISKLNFPFYVRKAKSCIVTGVNPLPSPNNRMIAHIKGNDLWLYDVEKHVDARLTNIGQPEDEKFASVFAEAVIWSPDSKRIMYRVLSGPTEPALIGHGHDWRKEKRDAEFGMRVIDVSTRDNSAINFLGYYDPNPKPVWLPDGKFLIAAGETTFPTLNDDLYIYNADNQESKKITKERALYSRPVISTDGRWALVNSGQRSGPDTVSPGKDLRTQIKKVDLNSGDVINITNLGRWGEFYSHALSPNGKSAAYFWKKSTDPNNWHGSVLVNGRELYSHDGLVRIIWVNETIITINSRSELVVIDTRSGKTLGVHKHSLPVIEQKK